MGINHYNVVNSRYVRSVMHFENVPLILNSIKKLYSNIAIYFQALANMGNKHYVKFSFHF